MAHAYRRTQAAAVMLLACTSYILQAAAMPMHPDLLSFVKLPVATGLEEELEQRAARRLQQTKGDLFQEGDGPFTFDGFGFGYGGVLPGGGFSNGFANNIYNILFRDILNEGLNQYVAAGITNNPLQPFDFIPPTIGKRFNRDVVSLFGYDAVDKFVGQYLTRAEAKLGSIVDAGCVGPTYSVTVKGGECEVADDGSVECEEPSIKLSSTPYVCNLPYRSKAKMEGQSFKYKVEFGRARKGELGLPAGVYNFGAAVNVTTPYLGVSLATARIANDFGVQQWYQFVGNLILNELLRIQAALLSGAVDSRILTTAAQKQANAAAAAAAAGTNRSSIVEGVAAVRGAGNVLLDKIASYMGIRTEDLTAGLKAANVLPEPSSPPPETQPQQQQRQQAQQQQGDTVVPNVMAGGQGDKVVTSGSDVKLGDQSLLNQPLVRKAEGAQPNASAQTAAKKAPKKKAAKSAAKKAPKKKGTKEP